MIFENDAINYAMWTIVALGALNWGLVAAGDVNIITDTLNLGTDAADLAYIAIGAAGAVNLADLSMEVL